MKITTKLSALLIVFAVLFTGWMLGLFGLWHLASDQIFALALRERKELVEGLLKQSEKTLQSFVQDHASQGLDSLKQARDKAAEQSDKLLSAGALEEHFAFIHDLDILWVWEDDFQDSGFMSRKGLNSLSLSRQQKEDIRFNLQKTGVKKFYLSQPEGLLQIVGVEVSGGSEQGFWLMAGRLWNAARLLELERLSASSLSWVDPDLLRGSEPKNLCEDCPTGTFETEITFFGPGELPQRNLSIRFESPSIASIERYFRLLWGAGACFFLMVIVVLRQRLHFWVTRPLRLLSESIENEDPGALRPLDRDKTEFGRLAVFMGDFFRQQMTLRREVTQREMAERNLRDSERQLRRLLSRREELARDLHDGIIQELYALGLQIESQRIAAQKVAPAIASELDRLKKYVNTIIGEVRQFIAGLAPEEFADKDLTAALEKHALYLRKTTSCGIEISCDDEAVSLLTRELSGNLYYICVELISNALRHAKPSIIRVSLDAAGSELNLTVENDGKPFRPPPAGHAGGLENIRIRANELGGAFSIGPISESQTRAQITLNLD